MEEALIVKVIQIAQEEWCLVARSPFGDPTAAEGAEGLLLSGGGHHNVDVVMEIPSSYLDNDGISPFPIFCHLLPESIPRVCWVTLFIKLLKALDDRQSGGPSKP